MAVEEQTGIYRGRIAPSPTGFLHLGHARTFWTAQCRARAAGGVLVYRNEDLDAARCRAEFAAAAEEDLKWLGLRWQEGPDCGGGYGPYSQSQRRELYVEAWGRLREAGLIYPCRCSRADIRRALQAPQETEDEILYPGTCRPERGGTRGSQDSAVHWRFRVRDGEAIGFCDANYGPQEFVAGKHFGDFVVWRQYGWPSYQLAVVVDDARMGVTEVVRGADLLVSTARQLLIYRALGWPAPRFYHCELVLDAQGKRLAKRHDALSLRALRERGESAELIRAQWGK